MRAKIKGIRSIPSSMKLEQSNGLNAKANDEYKIYSELVRLGREKGWLSKVKRNWQEGLQQIDKRLIEIEEQQESLKRQITINETGIAEPIASNKKREVVIRY